MNDSTKSYWKYVKIESKMIRTRPTINCYQIGALAQISFTSLTYEYIHIFYSVTLQR